MHAWVHRANNNVKKFRRKAELEGSEIEKKSYADALPGSTAKVQLELLVTNKLHDFVFLQVNQLVDEEINSDSDEEEDSRFISIVSSLKKRKDQRKEQKECDKKRRGAISGGADREIFKFQVVSANCQIAVAKIKSMIDFLQMAKGSSV